MFIYVLIMDMKKTRKVTDGRKLVLAYGSSVRGWQSGMAAGVQDRQLRESSPTTNRERKSGAGSAVRL